MADGASPDFSSRPRTANPKLVSLSLDSQAPRALSSSSQPSPVVSSRTATGKPGEGSILWSTEDVTQDELARPHTSNPRYVERLSLDTPRRDVGHGRAESPSRNSNDTTTAVLWASDANGVQPELLARPSTSNPWLHRFLDGVPDAKFTPVDDTPIQRRSEILWSDKEIEDWRMLARPHASNPAYETSASGAAEGSPSGAHISEVIWTSEEPADEPSAAELRRIIDLQQARIIGLEAEVRHLRGLVDLRDHRPAPPVAKKPAPAQVDQTPRHIPPSQADAVSSSTKKPLGSSPARPSPKKAAAATTRPTPKKESDAEFVREDDATEDDPMEKFLPTQHRQNETFAARLRNTTQKARPDTAAERRPPQSAEPQSKRPMSAPSARAAQGGVKFCALPTSFSALASSSAVSDSTIDEAYLSLKRPDERYISKQSFKKMYCARAEEYGMVVKPETVDRLLRPYQGAGNDDLTKEEFAVLYLQMQRW